VFLLNLDIVPVLTIDISGQREKNRLLVLKKKNDAAAKIQAAWRMKVAKEEFRSLRIHMLAAIEIQRLYRGYLGPFLLHL
jgi:hypothetical protein